MGREVVSIPEELACGPLEEQWIAAQLGCIPHDLINLEQDSCIEEAIDLVLDLEFQDEIFKCDARVHPNIANLEPPGPKATLEPSRILVVNKVGEMNNQLVKLQNVGSTCLFYSWKRISKESLVDNKKVVGRHVTDCWTFSIMKVKGSLLSGETQDFTFKFTSDVPGAFMETWELIIATKLKGDRLHVCMKGFALLDDSKRENREKLDKVLNYREMQSRYITSFLNNLFEKIVAGVDWTPPNSPSTHRKFRCQSKKQRKSPRLPCLRTLKSYHDRWIPNCSKEYDVSPLASPPNE